MEDLMVESCGDAAVAQQIEFSKNSLIQKDSD